MKAIYRPINELLIATYLMCVVCLVFTVVGLLAFRSLRDDDHYCKTVKECFFLNVYHGIVNGELVSIMKHVTNDANTEFHDLLMPANAELKRMFLQLLFNIATVLLLLNMIAGIILDAFTQETMESALRREKRDHETFATGLSRAYLESEELNFSDHQQLFSMINYVHFVGYIRDKDPSIDSPVEAYVRSKIDEGDSTWIPLGTCWALENQRRIKAAEKDDYAKLARRFDDLSAAAADRERALHARLDDLHKAIAAVQIDARRPSTVPSS